MEFIIVIISFNMLLFLVQGNKTLWRYTLLGIIIQLLAGFLAQATSQHGISLLSNFQHFSNWNYPSLCHVILIWLTNQSIVKRIFYGHLKQKCLLHCYFHTAEDSNFCWSEFLQRYITVFFRSYLFSRFFANFSFCLLGRKIVNFLILSDYTDYTD